MGKDKINVITGYRRGGPFNWGEQLCFQLNKRGNYQATHVHERIKLLLSPLWETSSLTHSTIPIPGHLWRHPYVLTVKGDYRLEKNPWQSLYPSAVKIADVITVPSQFLADKLQLTNAIIISNAIQLDRYPIRERPENEKVKLLTVTKFWFEDKAQGVLEIVKALKLLPPKQRHSMEYTVLGEGTYLEAVKEKVRDVDFTINFAGYQPPQKYLQQADLFLFYSHHDNMPNVILEAMASRLPVITNNIGAVGEIIDHKTNGLIAHNSQEYTQFVLSLINDDKMRLELADAARKKVYSHFNWNVIISDYEKIYHRLLG